MGPAWLALVGCTATAAACTLRTPLTSPPGNGGTVPAETSTPAGGTGGGGARGTGGTTGAAGTVASPRACDFFATGSTPCVAAHSTVRALFGAYAGALYQVMRADGSTRDIGVLAPGGIAAATVQDGFCASSACTVSVIFDQSGHGNHLGQVVLGRTGGADADSVDAAALAITLGGHKVYGLHLPAGIGYGQRVAQGVAMGDAPETVYMVVGGDDYNGGCCFDYGNVETNMTNDDRAATEAIYFGKCVLWGQGSGSGPWVMADLGDGLWPGDTRSHAANTPVTSRFVTAMVKGDSGNHWAIKTGDAQTGGLTSKFDGKRPGTFPTSMRKQGAIVLNLPGPPGNGGQGDFFEGAMTAGFASDATDAAVQADIVAAGYGR